MSSAELDFKLVILQQHFHMLSQSGILSTTASLLCKSLTEIILNPNINSSPPFSVSVSLVLLPHIPGVTQWTHSVWTWFTPASRFGPQWPTLPAPASFMSSVQTSGWQQSPSRMSTLPWCSSSFTRCVTSWQPTLARSARKTLRTTLCSSTSCWMVGEDICDVCVCSKFYPVQAVVWPPQSTLVISIAVCPSFSSYLLQLCLCFFIVHTEILDFGYPQNSETGALKTFITQQGIKGQVSKTSVDSDLIMKC